MKLINVVFGSMPSHGGVYPSSARHKPEERFLYHELRMHNHCGPNKGRALKQLIYVAYGNYLLSDGRVLGLQREVLSTDDDHSVADEVQYVQSEAYRAGWQYATLTIWENGSYSILYFQKDSA